MSRRFNFTGRVRILKEDIRITTETRGGRSFCNVHLKLAKYQLKSDANIVVEAERGRVLRHRHDWGHAGLAFKPEGASSEFDISVMGELEDLRFRVLVVEQGTFRLLASAEGVEAHNNDDIQEPQRSLLPIIRRDLHGGVWELDGMDDKPILVLDVNLGSKHEVSSSPVLLSILPGAIRAILVYQAQERAEEEPDEETGESTSASQWLEMGAKWAGCPCPPSSAEYRDIDEWAQNAVTGFCRDKKLRQSLSRFVTEED
ncbi:TPA: hypothetical protein ACHP3V_006029 [Pseudomonas aeruginosa]|uniref:hypothetical protein n=1 Tax=Pseudomonas aeruginosa TaxID=287 RepID=UPI0003B95312|nr:hypothetical protein [Pseudomonas aeruginosa]ERY75305.1 hypothetical protein Q029_02134 [Pseudomonas aeruginosa BWHPSA016]MBI7254140.1 hypothetical protein [Pseudomonas aeruginosa]MCS7788632.1 hypothetical protein [Pseudomonas aeruginosa]MCV0111373.1 hypothetical protein [Pseudomonas aeruginosa]MCV0117255.1 hypothetical protein [Pseudomonas aeruginosa]